MILHLHSFYRPFFFNRKEGDPSNAGSVCTTRLPMQMSSTANAKQSSLWWVHYTTVCTVCYYILQPSSADPSFRACEFRVIPSGGDWINCAQEKLGEFRGRRGCECSRLSLFPSNGSADRADMLMGLTPGVNAVTRGVVVVASPRRCGNDLNWR